MTLVYLAHDVKDPAIARRVRQLKLGGVEDIRLIGFRRSDGIPSVVEGVPVEDLGRTKDAALVRRSFSVILATVYLFFRGRVRAGDVIMARNLEMLVLVLPLRLRYRSRLRVVYELLDVHRLLLNGGFPGYVMRLLQKVACRSADAIVVSSLKFYECFLKSLTESLPRIVLVENKISEDESHRLLEENARERSRAAGVYSVGWYGMLRCGKSFRLLSAAASRSSQLEVHLRGVPVGECVGIEAICADLDSVHYWGKYDRATDLESIYTDIDFVWSVDFYEEGGNSEWLLPNRLYEGIHAGAIPIALAGTATAEWLISNQVGVVLNRDLSVESLLEQLGKAIKDVERLRASARNLPQSRSVMSIEEAEEFRDLILYEKSRPRLLEVVES